MCGIAGICQIRNSSVDVINDSLYSMAKAIEHRGPDDFGVFVDKELGLGFAHNRLSIVDLSSNGHQPMISRNSRYTIAFNGEIYNHKEIRRELNSSYDLDNKWNGTSDTETLLEAISVWGLENTLDKCTGMFAFSLFDSKEQELTLVRDRFGEKPLYYGILDNGYSRIFAFCSEISSFKALKNFELSINLNILSEFFKYTVISAPNTIFKDIYQLLPGNLLKLKIPIDNFKLSPYPWWDSMAEYTNAYESKFTDYS